MRGAEVALAASGEPRRSSYQVQRGHVEGVSCRSRDSRSASMETGLIVATQALSRSRWARSRRRRGVTAGIKLAQRAGASVLAQRRRAVIGVDDVSPVVHAVGRSPFQLRAYHSGCSVTSTLSHAVIGRSRMAACSAGGRRRQSAGGRLACRTDCAVVILHRIRAASVPLRFLTPMGLMGMGGI